MADNHTPLAAAFLTAWTEVQEAEKLQPGNYLVHTGDVQEVLHKLEGRVATLSQSDSALQIEAGR